MLPTLVFTLVIAEILVDRFGIEPKRFGALVIYALGTTMIPGLVLRLPPPDLRVWHEPADETASNPGGQP